LWWRVAVGRVVVVAVAVAVVVVTSFSFFPRFTPRLQQHACGQFFFLSLRFELLEHIVKRDIMLPRPVFNVRYDIDSFFPCLVDGIFPIRVSPQGCGIRRMHEGRQFIVVPLPTNRIETPR
jgi:hypothetical protein